MPPKRKASTIDRTAKESVSLSKVDSEKSKTTLKRSKSSVVSSHKSKKVTDSEGEDNESEEGEPKAKKAKKTKGPVTPIDPSLPHNTTVPTTLSFSKKAPSHTRISSWNVAGLSASLKKGFKTYVEAEDADILFISETKVAKGKESLESWIGDMYPHRYFGISPTKGQAGVLFLSKVEPLNVTYGLTTWKDVKETEGRIITLEFPTFYLLGTYVPNAGVGLKTLEFKNEWNAAFLEYLKLLDEKKPIMWTGDINCARTEIDIRNAKTNWNKTAGWTEAETTALEKQLSLDGHKRGRLVDVWREAEGNVGRQGVYTYYSYKFQCRSKGIGWRIDAFYVSETLKGRVHNPSIRSEVWGASDHTPIVIDIEGEL